MFIRVFITVFFVLLALFHVQAAIHGPKNKGVVEPIVIETELKEDSDANIATLFTEAANTRHSHQSVRRDVPTTSPPGFGTTVTLNDDHHTYGLVHWSGLPKERIFILTRKPSKGYSTESFLWISKDYGKSFEQITHLLPNDSVAEWYYISSNADELVFTDRINKRVYVTLDEGDSFIPINVSFVPDTLLFQKTWVSNVSSYENHLLGYDKHLQQLWVSKNTGQAWTKLGDNVTRYAWRELNETIEDPSTVYFDMKINDTLSLLYKASDQNNYQPQLFDSSLGPFMPGTFTLSRQYMFVQKNYTVLGVTSSLSPLWVSHMRKPFQPAGYPLDLDEKHYALVDASENQVLMAVYHDPNNTHVYLSEEAGLNYTLSLSNIISPPESEWIDSYPTFDVYVVESLVGTYIANRNIPTSNHGSTVISFDKGGEWSLVTPPSVDRNGEPTTCNPPCSLHLHMFVDSSYFIQPILSQDSAPGIIMAIGNTGTNIVNNKNKLRLYMSDNGGVTWRELFTDYKQFQLLNYGVFIAVVDKAKTAFYTQISCDEGYNWLNYTFTNYTSKVRVVAMFTERGEASQHATIFAYNPGVNAQTFEWLVIDLDFTTLNLSQCSPDDYYLWKPTDERANQECILGESIEYERRLPDRCCYIDTLYDRPINRTNCQCTKEDFECELNFERVDLDGPCQAVDGYQYPPVSPDICPELANYSYTSGYRKIASDKCVQGKDTFFLPVVKDCPVQAPGDIDLRTTNNVQTVLVGDTVTFQFTQGQGAVLSTEYTWSYGDNVTSSYTGFDKAAATSHIYLYPGSYEAQIKALNSGGQAVDDIIISISDELLSATIVSPDTIFTARPTNFYANVTTKYNTTTIFDIKYTWKISGRPYPKDNGYFSYLFTSSGEYTIELTVSYAGGIKEDTITVTVTDDSPAALSSSKKSYLPLAVSIGVGGLVLIVVAIAITIGAIIYYRRKYRSLEIRYSRLRQGPMRFTFSAEGENIEEEDWKEDDEDDNEDKVGVVNEDSTQKL